MIIDAIISIGCAVFDVVGDAILKPLKWSASGSNLAAKILSHFPNFADSIIDAVLWSSAKINSWKWVPNKVKQSVTNLAASFTMNIKSLFMEASDEVVEALVRFSDDMISKEAINATHNAGSKTVMLGKTNGTRSYVAEAKKYGATYFQMSDRNWDDLLELANGDIDAMWDINKKFLDNQVESSKRFILSEIPYNQNGFFSREVNYLKEKGYKFQEIFLQGGIYYEAFR